MTADVANNPPPRPSIQLFGRFRLSLGGKNVDLPGRKARGVLAFLTLSAGASASRDQLADLLWTDRGPEQARASLRQSLKELRELSCLADAISTERSTVAMDLSAVTIDLHEIRHAAAARDLPSLALLLGHVGGDLLEDFLDVAPAFDEWLRAERPRQRDLVLDDALEAVETDGLADMKNARTILRALDRIDPVNDAVVRLGMRLDHAVGDGASLHRRYRQLCDRLEQEFDALPSEDTRALFHSLAENRDQPADKHVRGPPAGAATRPIVGGGDMVPLVIVAPLQASGSDPALASLADLCTDDIRVSLSRTRGIHVLALDDAELSGVLQQGDDALGIYLLSGTLRQIGADFRVNIQLANASSRIILWSESLRFGAADEEMLDAIVGKAAGAVLPAVDRDLDARLRQSAHEIHDERAIYTRARLLIRSGDQLATVEEGVRLLEAIVASNPQHFGARMLLFRMYNTDFWQRLTGHDVRQFRATAQRHLDAAAAIEPGSYAVRIGQAWSHLRNGETQVARREFESVLSRLPHDADATDRCAMGLCLIGQVDEAERLMQRAFFLNPFPPSDYHADYALLLALKGEHEAAEEHFAVSGETGLLYAAVRIANAAHLDGGEVRIAELGARFVGGFRRAWQPTRDPTLSDLLDWIGETLPLHPADKMQWLRKGLEQMLEPTWPTGRGNGS